MKRRHLGLLAFFLMVVIGSAFVIIESCKVKGSPGDILYVGGSGPGNYSSIQDAIDDAAIGSTVYVYSGTYYEQINITKEIHLIGENKHNTMVDGTGAFEYNFYVWNAHGSTIEGFSTVRGDNYFRADHLFLKNNVFTQLEHVGRYSNISFNKIHGNVYLTSSNTKRNVENWIGHNKINGTIYCYSGYLNIITSNVITGKSRDCHGIYVAGDGNIIFNNTIEGKSSSYKSYMECGIKGEGDANVIYNNTIRQSAYGIRIKADSSKLRHSNIVQIYNNRLSDCGLGIKLSGTKEVHVHENSISGATLGIVLDTESYIEYYYYDYTLDMVRPHYSKFGCENINIEKNTIRGYLTGIHITGEDGDFAHSNISITANILDSENETDMMGGQGEGIQFEHDCTNISIVKNSIHNGEGITFWQSVDGPISVFHNNFINNIYPVLSKSFCDKCISGTYFNFRLKEGNYWSEYKGSDEDSNDIGDIPYEITEDIIDPFPLMKTSGNYIHTPTASFSYSPNNPTTMTLINFTDTSHDVDGCIVSWNWDFGDGTTSKDANPNHRYEGDGLYSVTLTVTDIDGAEDINSTNIEIKNIPPTARFTPILMSNVKVGVPLDFTDVSTDPDGDIVNCTWNFGDGTTGYGQTTNHTYTAPGTYNVTLTVKDDDGATDSYITSVVIKAPSKDEDGIPSFGLALIVVATAAALVLMKRKRY